MDLFSGLQGGGTAAHGDESPDEPLASRMRPRSFSEFVGQEHIIGPGTVLRRSIEQDQLGSLILWGPPGSGKTTLAEIIANVTKSRFYRLSAVSAGVADLRKVVEDAKKLKAATGQRTIMFIDEIHRFNKGQQDAILPYVEKGQVVLIGATTENPSFEVNSALLSRSRVFTLRALTETEVEAIVRRALADSERGLGGFNVRLQADALRHLVSMANGDARIALNALELAANATQPDDDGVRNVSLEDIEDAMQHRALLYDRAGEEHFNTISALHKAIRGSDPQGALYWLGRMLEAGEDPLYIARRLVRAATEDIGLADPQALVLAIATQQAVHFIGMPEGALALAELAVYLATSPKSNSVYTAYNAVKADIKTTRNEPVPLHIRNPVTRLMKELGYGKGYRYAHEYPEDSPERFLQTYLPDSLKGRTYYRPSDQGFEREIAKRIKQVAEIERRAKSQQGEEHL